MANTLKKKSRLGWSSSLLSWRLLSFYPFFPVYLTSLRLMNFPSFSCLTTIFRPYGKSQATRSKGKKGKNTCRESLCLCKCIVYVDGLRFHSPVVCCVVLFLVEKTLLFTHTRLSAYMEYVNHCLVHLHTVAFFFPSFFCNNKCHHITQPTIAC